MNAIDFWIGLVAGLAVMWALLCIAEACRVEQRRRLVAAQNLSDLARVLTLLEGGRAQLSIAQVREVVAVLGVHLRCLPPPQADALLEAIRQRAGLNRGRPGADREGDT